MTTAVEGRDAETKGRDRGVPFNESTPSALKLSRTSRTRSALANVTSTICRTAMPWADSNTLCALRQVTTEPLLRRTIRSSWLPSSLPIGRTHTRWTISHLLRVNRPGFSGGLVLPGGPR